MGVTSASKGMRPVSRGCKVVFPGTDQAQIAFDHIGVLDPVAQRDLRIQLLGEGRVAIDGLPDKR